MLARSSSISHPLGSSLETPLLVPSFSTKGFNIKEGTNEGQSGSYSEARTFYEIAKSYLTDITLISAYDLYHRHFAEITDAVTEIIIIDSGGYEISSSHDFSAINCEATRPLEKWTIEKLRSVYDGWPVHIPAIFVSYDNPHEVCSLRQQIDSARKLFSTYKHQMNTILLKPERKKTLIDANLIIPLALDIKDFNVVGVTEKELGYSVLDRMVNVALLRRGLDQAGVSVPIHVFGSLDPISSVLYFLAGAEIFDGLTWLRYAYAGGMACYYHNYSVKMLGIEITENLIRERQILDNIIYLLKLTNQMKKFIQDEDFGHFGENEIIFRDCYVQLINRI